MQQVKYATSSSNSILEDLTLYKQRSRHLVICLSGDKPIDLKKHFLQALKKALESEAITDSIAQQICQQPLQYLESLDTKQRKIAEAFLKRQGNPEGDLNMLVQLLRDDNYQVIPRVKEICRELTGVTPDFEADIDVEAILTDLVTRLCTGANPHFQGILILLDELYNYLQLWANDPVRAGSTTLQNITNICERFKGRVALISFTQRRPDRVTPSKNFEDYKRLVSRLELLPSTYEPAASLELVLHGLLSQQDKTTAWQEFFSKWRDTLNAINTDIYQNRTANYYQNRNWLPQKFLEYITLGCFPLHPLTSYLLCNLDFTQGRTAIQFVQEDVKRFIQEQPIEKNSNINLIHPVALIDAFEDNFSTSDTSSYSAYKHAYDSIVASAAPEELTVLKSLFLFYASASTSRLTKSDKERHEEILSLLAGMPKVKVKTVLDKLCKVREVIYHNPANNTYHFYTGGFSIQDLRQRIEEEVANKIPSIERVREYYQSNLGKYSEGDSVSPTQFIEDNRLVGSDWAFRCEVYTVAKLRKTLISNQTLKDEIGIVAYVIGGTSEELAALRSETAQLLTSSHDLTSIKRRIAVAIASQPASDIASLLLMLDTANRKSVQEFGAALTQLQQQLQQQIETKTKELFKSCIYHCHVSDKVPVNERSNRSQVVSEILKDLYPFVPPVEKIDKMARKSTVGSKVIGFASKRLLENDLRPPAFPEQSYATTVDLVFVRSWGLLKKSSHNYSIQVPQNPKVRAAWDKISEMSALGDRSEKAVEIAEIWRVLSQPPYGYNEYTFTILFAGWLAYNSSELLLKGSFGIPQKRAEQVPRRTEPIKNWANTNVFDKPKDFVRVWIENGKPSLIRRKLSPCPEVPDSVNYEQAWQFVQKIDSFLYGAPDPEKIEAIAKIQQQLTSSIEQIAASLEPTSQAENLLKVGNLARADDIESLVQLYTNLRQPLPTIAADGLSVSPTEQQQTRRLQALQAITERIGYTVKASECSQLLNTEADCVNYKADIQHLIAQLNQVADLPSWFTTTLQEALKAADNRVAEIVEQRKVEDCLSQIQKLYNTLSDLATQQEYIRTQSEIEQLVESVPTARERDAYRNIIQALEDKQDALIRQVADWEDQYSPSLSLDRAVQLSHRIHQQLNRYTAEGNQQRLQELLEKLNVIILERKSEEQEADQLQSLITSAKGKLQDIEILNNLSDAFQAYQALSQLVLPSTAKTTSGETQKQLEALRAEGYNIISRKILQIVDDCQRHLKQPQDYDRLKRLLQKRQELVSGNEFAAIRSSLEKAEQNLETQYEDLQKRLQDEKAMQVIRQYTPAKANTIHLCEEAINEITSSYDKLHHLQFKSELDKLIQEFKDKIVTYQRCLHSLGNRLSTVETSKALGNLRDEYAKLELVFKDSTCYPAYQQLQGQIHLLESDIERIHNLETLYQQSQSIAACEKTLEGVVSERNNLHNLDRFKSKILQIENQLCQKKQEYIQQLDELQSKLSSVKTLNEAQKLQKELADRSTYYRESQEEEQYEAISSEVSLLISLLKITAVQKVDCIQTCQVELERLSQWQRETREEIPPNVQALLDSSIHKVEQAKQQIQKRQKRAASAWLESIVEQAAQLEQLTDSAKKLEVANQLLSKLKKQRQQHEDLLEIEQQILERIFTRCEVIQNQDTESKILTLFQDLPRQQQDSLLKRLAEYVSEAVRPATN